MKTLNVILLLAVAFALATYQAAGARGRRPVAPVDDDSGLDEAPISPPRRRQTQRSRAPVADDEIASAGGDQDGANYGNAEDSSSGASDTDNYQAPVRSRGSAPRRRYQDPDLDERPAAPRRRPSRRGNRGRGGNGSSGSSNNNNNLNFNGLPDGFPSAAFGAGFGAAVSSGGRGRGPSNAAGFGAGFAQSGGGNALAGGFGSGLVNNGGGNRNNDDNSDDDSDYDSGRSYNRRRNGYRD